MIFEVCSFFLINIFFLAIVAVAEWYRKHLDHKIPIVLLTVQKMKDLEVKEGVKVGDLETYLNATYPENTTLKDLYESLTASHAAGDSSSDTYEEVTIIYFLQLIVHSIFLLRSSKLEFKNEFITKEFST